MKLTNYFILIFLLVSSNLFAQQATLKVACIGNSITAGYLLDNPSTQSYPSQLQSLLGNNYRVGNFGHSGATLLRKGHNPYFKTKAFADLIKFKPDIAVIHLGLNDTDPRNFPNYRDEFIPDYNWLIDTIKKENPKVKIYLCSLTPIFSGHPRFVSSTFDWYWILQDKIKEIAKINNLPIIDLNSALHNRPDLFPDQLHPIESGAAIIANTVFQNLSGNFNGLQIPEIFTDNMVLQRNEPIKIWGKANAGTIVEVKFLGQLKSTKVGFDGNWRVVFPASKEVFVPQDIEIKAEDKTLVLKNILIGDVWLCSGQSNMYFPVAQSIGADSILKSVNEKLPIRLFKFKPLVETDNRSWTANELQNVNELKYFSGSWQLNSVKNVSSFSAVGHVFGSEIFKNANVPIGLIEVAVGGSPLISWLSRETLESSPLFVQSFKNWTKSDFLMQWCRERAAKNIKEASNPFQRHPYEPAYNFEAGIAKLVDFPIKGVTWYQGESDAENSELYQKLFPLFVKDWRKQWGKALPFYYVQLSSIERPGWNYFRDSQRKLLKALPNLAMAVSSDLGDRYDVHPRNKIPVGERLARLALHNSYGKSIVPSGPLFQSVKKVNNQLIVTFTYSAGLRSADGQLLRGFEIYTQEGVFVPVAATLKDNKVVIKIPKNTIATQLAYAWQPFTTANLVNKVGLPASTFLESIK